MKYLFILFLLLLAQPCAAADATAPEKQAPTAEKSDKAAENAKTSEEKTAQPAPGEYSCKYYSVKLPEGWKAYLPPQEKQGMVSALFGQDSQNPVVTMTITQSGGLDLKTIAEMFAKQFQSAKAPVEKNGQYVFSITRNDMPGQIWISSQGPLVMITGIAGNLREGLNFLKNNVKKDDYKDLFPK